MKNGIDYVALNTGFFDDDKIALIEVDHGYIGSYVVIRLLCKIYDAEGYYCNWGIDERKLFVRRIGGKEFDLEKLDAIIESCFHRDFFDRGLYEKYQILTSRGIQRRFLDATSRRIVSMTSDYLLVPDATFKYTNVKFVSLDGKQVTTATPAPNPEPPVDPAPIQERPGFSGTDHAPRRSQKVQRRKDATSIQIEDHNILHLFFFNNWKNPGAEFDKFKRWNERQFVGKFDGWEKIPKTIRQGAALDWKQEPATTRFAESFLTAWGELYTAFSKEDVPFPILQDCLSDSIQWESGEEWDKVRKEKMMFYTLTCPRRLADYIKTNHTLLPSVMKKLYDAGQIRFTTC